MSAALKIRGVRSVAVEVPMKLPLGTSAQKIDRATLLLIDLDTDEGVTGRSYVFCVLKAVAAPVGKMLQEAARIVAGERVVPFEIRAKLLRHFRLMGVQGIVRMALSGLDMACWDALAIASGVPLVRLLGGEPKKVPAYNSNGLGLMAPEPLADEAEALLEGGFRAAKLRLGYPTLAADLAAVRAVRRRLPDEILLMVDYNQALTVTEAIRRGHALDGEGIYWIEEPIRHDDYAGNAAVSTALKTPVQIGENFSLPQAMGAALAAKACDYVMPDLERIGGVSGWLHAAGLAAANEIDMSSHLYSEVSAHLLAVTPTAHWLEYMDWADPILREPIRIVEGAAVAPDRPGAGLEWNDDAVARYRIE
jgi:mandelate racemase